jgi:predicted O-methyltransferase YrrM
MNIERMDGTFSQRLARLAKFLLRHPSWIPRYPLMLARHILKVPPLKLGLPWISQGALDALDAYVRKDHAVAEFGGGGSSVYFASRAGSLLCLESSEAWAADIRAELSKRGLGGVEIAVLPFDPNDLEAFKASEYLHGLKGPYDIILVDGYEDRIHLRPYCFWEAEKHVKAGGIIIVDDSWRYPEIRANHKAKRWQEYRSIGHTRYGITTTDIYYY